uniref:Calponin-homology (CH) domain-containing protein n=1 Tax=Plectus sambesii TaxID=2011161 RepID=A0A914WSN7_9BILA
MGPRRPMPPICGASSATFLRECPDHHGRREGVIDEGTVSSSQAGRHKVAAARYGTLRADSSDAAAAEITHRETQSKHDLHNCSDRPRAKLIYHGAGKRLQIGRFRRLRTPLLRPTVGSRLPPTSATSFSRVPTGRSPSPRLIHHSSAQQFEPPATCDLRAPSLFSSRALRSPATSPDMAAGWKVWTGNSQYPEIQTTYQNGSNGDVLTSSNYGPKQDRAFRIGWIQGKRDLDHEWELMQWMAKMVGQHADSNAEFGEFLKDGTVLCKLMQKLRPGSVPRISAKSTSFAISDNINSFLRAAADYGLRPADLFELTDLTERHNIARVVSTVDALAALAQTRK